MLRLIWITQLLMLEDIFSWGGPGCCKMTKWQNRFSSNYPHRKDLCMGLHREKTALWIYTMCKHSDEPAHLCDQTTVFILCCMSSPGPIDSSYNGWKLLSDKTAWMHWLIWVFIGNTCPKVRFLTRLPLFTSVVQHRRMHLFTCKKSTFSKTSKKSILCIKEMLCYTLVILFK